MSEILPSYNRIFLANPSEEEQLTIETCPGYEKALIKAEADSYEWKMCDDCPLQVRTHPATDNVVVFEKCPKI